MIAWIVGFAGVVAGLVAAALGGVLKDVLSGEAREAVGTRLRRKTEDAAAALPAEIAEDQATEWLGELDAELEANRLFSAYRLVRGLPIAAKAIAADLTPQPALVGGPADKKGGLRKPKVRPPKSKARLRYERRVAALKNDDFVSQLDAYFLRLRPYFRRYPNRAVDAALDFMEHLTDLFFTYRSTRIAVLSVLVGLFIGLLMVVGYTK